MFGGLSSLLANFVGDGIISYYNGLISSHLETPANGQAVIFLTGLLEVFISEISFCQQYQTVLYLTLPYPISLFCVFVFVYYMSYNDLQ